jgi:xanthine dehydrogenase accessory factor
MQDVLDQLDAWRQAGDELAVATVINTWGSAPRPVGSKMVMTRAGGIAGSVSAGCVEGAVIEAGMEVMASGQPQLLSYGVADDQAWQVGLACGGTIQVFVEPGMALDGIYSSLKRRLEARDPMTVISLLKGPADLINRKLILLPDGRVEGDLQLGDQAEQISAAAMQRLEAETGGVLEFGDDFTYFIEVYPPPPRLIIIGAVHLAEVLVQMASLVGFDAIVIDPRRAFATRQRFPQATALLQSWPQEALDEMVLDRSAYIAVLTHDPKLDDPALELALGSQARYVGALGSRRTNRLRLERLREAGLSEENIARLHAPIGLDLGGRSPGEIAVSIMAEIIQERSRGAAQVEAR